MHYEQLQDHLFSQVPCSPEVINFISSGISTWEAFCRLPQEIKELFTYPVDVDSGYFRKGQKTVGDRKQYYHFRGTHSDLLEQYGLQELVDCNSILTEFFNYAQKVYDLTRPIIEDVANDLGRRHPEVVSHGRSNPHERTLRFLLYDPYDPTRENLAYRHFDRGGYTVQWFASHPGLEYLDWDGAWKPLASATDTATLIAGYSLEKLTGGELQKTWHRVVPPPDLLPGVERTSVVSFNELPKEYDYDQSVRAQDHEPSYVVRT